MRPACDSNMQVCHYSRKMVSNLILLLVYLPKQKIFGMVGSGCYIEFFDEEYDSDDRAAAAS